MLRFFLRIWNWLRAEIVFGFLIGSVFWTATLGWQAAYAPTDVEKQKCYDAAHKAGHKSEECKTVWEKTTSDPVAFFTLVLAISTVGLWTATIGLYVAGERQLAHAQVEAEAADFHRTAQFEQISAQIEALEQTAHAAEENLFQAQRLADNAEITAQRQLRAYIGISEVRIYHASGEWQPNIQISYKNYGQTPAHAVGNSVTYFFHISGTPTFDMKAGKGPRPLYLAPTQEKSTSVLIPQAQWELFKDAIARKSVVFFIFGEIHYTDVFGVARWTRFRLQLDPDEDGIKEDGFVFCDEGNDAN